MAHAAIVCALFLLSLCASAAEARPNAPDHGPCATLTTRPGFLVSGNKTQPIYLSFSLDQLTFPVTLGQRSSLYSHSLIHRTFTPGCYGCGSNGCLAVSGNKTIAIDSGCNFLSPTPLQQFEINDDNSITNEGSCWGVSADGTHFVVGACSSMPPAQRFFWFPWDF